MSSQENFSFEFFLKNTQSAVKNRKNDSSDASLQVDLQGDKEEKLVIVQEILPIEQAHKNTDIIDPFSDRLLCGIIFVFKEA
jgi:hypothetical protein